MKVKQIIHKGVEWVSPSTPVTTLAKKMLNLDVGAIPVGENDRLIGMVTDRDIALRALADGKDPSKLTAKDVMTKGIIWCRDSDDVNEAARTMESKKGAAAAGDRRRQAHGRHRRYFARRVAAYVGSSDEGRLSASRLKNSVAGLVRATRCQALIAAWVPFVAMNGAVITTERVNDRIHAFH
jgi:CBS domain-containing protein